jgi:hypothetical protein
VHETLYLTNQMSNPTQKKMVIWAKKPQEKSEKLMNILGDGQNVY